MPRIVFKPNSPEFADSETKNSASVCDMPGCIETGEYKAPKDRALSDYYRFCLDHVREYNKAWDFFSGMSAGEVEDHMLRSMYGDRPTWRYGVEGENAEEVLKQQAWNTYNFSEEESANKPGSENEHGHNINRNTPEFEAMAIMGLEPPLIFEDIKIRYKELAKKHHPDLNKGCKKSEELLKHINMAYTILKLAYNQFEKLPDRD